MITVREGEKREIIAGVTKRGGGTFSLTSPQMRILTATRQVAVDWASCSWDPAASELFGVFDSTLAQTSATGTYFVQLRGTIANELYGYEVEVRLLDWGP